MIRSLEALLDSATVTAYRRQFGRAAVYAIGEGLAFGLTLPVLAALLRGEIRVAAGWFVALVVVAAGTQTAHSWQTVEVGRTTIAAINALHAAPQRTLCRCRLTGFPRVSPVV